MFALLKRPFLLSALVLVSSAQADPESLPAKELFGRQRAPAALPPQAIGFYSRGCLAGAVKMPDAGPAWQTMRPSRNRAFGHPELIAFLKRFASQVRAEDGWPGILIGDLSQPRGGPMLSGHASHQVGLDADIWLMPPPKRRLSWRERERLSAVSVVDRRRLRVKPKVWTRAHFRVLKRAASFPEVERIFVHPAIKKALCEQERGDRRWLAKVRPWWGHDDHFHIRLKCPEDSPLCRPQEPPPPGDGCGEELAWWFEQLRKPPKPPRPRPPLELKDLPEECRLVLAAPPREGKVARR